jgi:hypothetical protein
MRAAMDSACSYFSLVLTGRRPARRYRRHSSNAEFCPEASAIPVLVAPREEAKGGEPYRLVPIGFFVETSYGIKLLINT